MATSAYIRIEFTACAPELFCESLSVIVAGEMRNRKHSGAPFNQLPLHYWKSHEVTGDDSNFDYKISNMVKKLCEFLISKDLSNLVDVSLVYVCKLSSDAAPRGFFVEPDTVRLLSGVGGSIDIDFI